MVELINEKHGINIHVELMNKYWLYSKPFIIRETGEMFLTEKEAFQQAKKLFKKLKRK